MSTAALGLGLGGLGVTTAPFEVKAIDVAGRIIEGYAAVFGNLDAYRDVIEPGAFDATLAQKRPQDIGVYLGHEANRLPVGVCLELRVDARGLYTRTRVLSTTEGNDLLVAAQELAAAGRPLGMSIGFYARDAAYDQLADGTPIRRLTAVDLIEYSFVGLPANTEARVVAVKSLHALLAELAASGTVLGAAPAVKTVTDSDWAKIEQDLPKMPMVDLVATHRRLHQWAARGTTLTGFTRADMDHLHALVEKELRRRAKEDGRDPPEPTPLEWDSAKDAPEASGEREDEAGENEEKHLPDTVQEVVQREKEKEQGKKDLALDLARAADGLAALAAAAETVATKAGRVMSQKNLDRLHGILADLGEMHAQVCDMADACPMGTGRGQDGTARVRAREVRERLRVRLALAGRGYV